jgi:poly(3-hydroxybutyrate) depolymerase
VHVALHGCRMSVEQIGERFVREAGYNRWADTNRLIVLYPQAIARYWGVYNPRGCWDWWGYTGSRYATKEGAQIRAVMGMVERLGAPR